MYHVVLRMTSFDIYVDTSTDYHVLIYIVRFIWCRVTARFFLSIAGHCWSSNIIVPFGGGVCAQLLARAGADDTRDAERQAMYETRNLHLNFTSEISRMRFHA